MQESPYPVCTARLFPGGLTLRHSSMHWLHICAAQLLSWILQLACYKRKLADDLTIAVQLIGKPLCILAPTCEGTARQTVPVSMGQLLTLGQLASWVDTACRTRVFR